MVLLIRTHDGRTTICTASPRTAAAHLERLKTAPRLSTTDLNGRSYTLTSLRAHIRTAEAVPL